MILVNDFLDRIERSREAFFMLPEYVPGFLSETEPLQLPGTCGLKPFSRGLRRSSKKRSAASSQTGNLQWLQWFLGCVGWSLSGLRAAA